MVDTATPVQEQPIVLLSEGELQAKLIELASKGDFKAIMKLTQEQAKATKAHEQELNEAKLKALAGKTESVRDAINKVIAKFVERGELDQADGVWYSRDFNNGDLIECKLTKTVAKKASAGGHGGGGGKKFDIKTEDILAEVGHLNFGDGTNGTIKAGEKYAGQQVKAAWDSSADKNWRYGIREALLKYKGVV